MTGVLRSLWICLLAGLAFTLGADLGYRSHREAVGVVVEAMIEWSQTKPK